MLVHTGTECSWCVSDPGWGSGVLPRDPPHLLRLRPHAARHRGHRRGRRPAAAGHHRRAHRLQEEDARRRPHPEAPAAADGQPGVTRRPGVQRGYGYTLYCILYTVLYNIYIILYTIEYMLYNLESRVALECKEGT